MVTWAHVYLPHHKRYLDRFICFCRAHSRHRRTQTEDGTSRCVQKELVSSTLRRCGLVIINGNLSLEVAPTPATFSRSSIVSVLFCSDSVPIRACFQPLVFLTSLSREHIGNWHVTEVQNFAMTFLKSEKRAKAEMTCVESNAITRQFRH